MKGTSNLAFPPPSRKSLPSHFASVINTLRRLFAACLGTQGHTGNQSLPLQRTVASTCTSRISAFCTCGLRMVLRIISGCVPKQHRPVGLCSGDVTCFLGSTDLSAGTSIGVPFMPTAGYESVCIWKVLQPAKRVKALRGFPRSYSKCWVDTRIPRFTARFTPGLLGGNVKISP
jgi:hypothetical protein